MAKRTKAERKAKRKAFFAKAKKAVAKAATAPAKAAIFAATIPFRPMMVSILKKRGAEPKKKQSELVEQFYKNVVKKESFESEYLEQENLVEDIAEIVKAVVSFFKGRKERLKEKEAAGEELTEGEKNFVDNVEGIEKAATDAIKEDVKENVGKKVVETATNPLFLIAVAFGLYYLFKGKKASA